jgi:hypothetical protein
MKIFFPKKEGKNNREGLTIYGTIFSNVDTAFIAKKMSCNI